MIVGLSSGGGLCGARQRGRGAYLPHEPNHPVQVCGVVQVADEDHAGALIEGATACKEWKRTCERCNSNWRRWAVGEAKQWGKVGSGRRWAVGEGGQ